MLPSSIDALLREQISTDLLVKGKSQRDVVQAALAKRGMRPPGIVSAQAQLEEIGNRSKIIADAIIKVLQDVKVSPYAGLVDDLVSLYETHYQAVIAEWKPRVLEAWNQSAGHGAGHIQSRLAGSGRSRARTAQWSGPDQWSQAGMISRRDPPARAGPRPDRPAGRWSRSPVAT